MARILSIALGGAAGALLRYWLSSGVYRLLGQGFPYGTLVINVTGCLAMGLLYALLVERMDVAAEWRAAILIGILGAYTTFSAFTMETLSLMEAGEPMKAILNVLLSVVLCLLACWAGFVVGRQL